MVRSKSVVSKSTSGRPDLLGISRDFETGLSNPVDIELVTLGVCVCCTQLGLQELF